MSTVVFQDEKRLSGLTIPDSVVDLPSFMEWADSPAFPDTERVTYLNGIIYVDVSMEQLFIHNLLKLEIATVLKSMSTSLELGYVFSDGARLQNARADLSAEPDVTFVSFDALSRKRVRLGKGSEGGFVSLAGSPELVVEVVSESSEQKDYTYLREAYHKAGIYEYWIVDAREDKLTFDTLKRVPKAFVASRTQPGGWRKSAVFGQSFRLVRKSDRFGNPQFTLEHRD